jgi:hypothetical protein
MEPVVTESAHKHGCEHEDIIHAFVFALWHFDLRDDFIMYVGPNRAALLLEVGVVTGKPAPVIIHAMPARPKYLR